MVKYQKLAKSVGRNEGFWIISDIGNFGILNQKYCLDGVVKLVVDFAPLITYNLMHWMIDLKVHSLQFLR